MKALSIPDLRRDVSRLGIGSMIFAPERKDLVFDLLDAFRGVGGNLIDSSEVYGGGLSEAAIGMYFAERDCREEWVLLDKGCASRERVRPEIIHESIGASLERLGTDYIDIWALHRDDPAVPVGEIVEALNEEKARGRIRAFGGSNWTTARIDEANACAASKGLAGMCLSSPNVCLAIPKEPFWPDCTHATAEDVARHAETRVPLFAWSSQGRGFFLDDCGPENTSNADLVRVYHSGENFERLARARELARARDVKTIQIALAYVLNLPTPTVALVGPATVEEVASCAEATAIYLSPAEMAWLNLSGPKPS
jgi:aryl-alcohol dehydrogenase-like predicted oxidoreductase